MNDCGLDNPVREPGAKPIATNGMVDRADLQLVDLIEFVSTCEAAAMQLDRIDAAFKCRGRR